LMNGMGAGKDGLGDIMKMAQQFKPQWKQKKQKQKTQEKTQKYKKYYIIHIII
jgi:uncharacterized membrane protein